MTRPPLSERRRTHTRRDIAESAVTLFARDGYDNVSVEDISEEAGISLRTFYRYFSAKDEVLSPILTQATEDLLDHIARRPAAEDLAEAVEHAYRQVSPPTDRVQALIRLFIDVPALQARWLNDLRALEAALVPVVRQRTLVNDHDAHLSAALIVTALRVTLEQSTRDKSAEPLADTLSRALRYLRNGARL
jgi:AcrR family transcriptional regulator